MYYTKQVSQQTKKIQKQKFIMAFAKQHSSSDMRRTIGKHSTTSKHQIPNWYRTIKRILEYNISKQNLERILGNFGNPQFIQSSKRCLQCLNEKLAIALHKDDNMLNKRSEIISKCRHRNKYMLASYDSKD